MKYILSLLTNVLSVGVLLSASVGENLQRIDENARNFIVKEGYGVRNYTVKTQDGYLLDLLRISGYRQNFTGDYISQYTGLETSEETTYKQVVLLMPAMMGSWIDFVAGGQSAGLAFALANVGYDVFLGNTRGSVYGQRHVKLDPKHDDDFWKYSWHEMGVKDLPAIIDKVLSVTGESFINYVGHMEGATIFYVMASEKPQYNDKIRKMLALGPVVYLNNSKQKVLNWLERSENEVSNSLFFDKDVWRNAVSRLDSRFIYDRFDEDECNNYGHKEMFCRNAYFLMNGFNSRHYNKTTIEKLLSHTTKAIPEKQILHYLQNKVTGSFNKYNPDFNTSQPSGEAYDLSKVTTKVAIFYTSEDVWSQPEDVQKLIEELPNVLYSELVEGLSNNVDLLYADNVDTIVHGGIIQLLKQVEQRA